MNRDTYIKNTLGRMSVRQKIGQCIVVGMSGTVITNDLREAITKYHCSGVRLSPFFKIFRYFSDDKAKKMQMPADYSPSMEKMMKQDQAPWYSPEQYAAMLNELRDLAAQRDPAIPLHMVIDQEGDTSKDFSRGGVVQFPSNMGILASKDPQTAYEVARAVGKQLKASGLDMIHSPVVDVNINPDNPEIGRRSFGDDPAKVAEYAIAMVKGFKEVGIIAAAKHFPGRGDSATDAHHACPTLNVDMKRFHDVELYPYKKLIDAGIDSVMVAHCMYPMIDKERISTVSPSIVTNLLRNELGFKGVITTDSMTMGALIDKYGVGESCARALSAGADIILMKAENQWRGEMFYTVEKWVKDGRISETDLDAKIERILGMKYDYGMVENMGKVDASKAAEPFSDPFVLKTAVKAAESAIMVPKDDLKALPLDKSKKVLLVNQLNTTKSPNDWWDHPSLFSELMEKDWPELESMEVDFGYCEEDEAKVLSVAEKGNYDLIICTNFYDRGSQPQSAASALIAKGYPVVLVTNTPYCIKGKGGMLTDAGTIVLNMNLTPQGYKTAKEVLFGETEAKGKWPLTNFDPLGLNG